MQEGTNIEWMNQLPSGGNQDPQLKKMYNWTYLLRTSLLGWATMATRMIEM
jgi:hypothetical protein